MYLPFNVFALEELDRNFKILFLLQQLKFDYRRKDTFSSTKSNKLKHETSLIKVPIPVTKVLFILVYVTFFLLKLLHKGLKFGSLTE